MIKFKKRLPTALSGIALAGLSAVSTSTMAAPDQTQIDALRAVYESLNGQEWADKTGWVDAQSNPCEGWLGVTCDASGTNVTELVIEGNNAFGSISSAISGLTELQKLVITNTGLNDSGIPASIGSLSKLRGLFLNDNNLAGGLPAELGQLTNLLELILDDNMLTGTIPTEVMSLTKLYGLRLHGNRLSGPIPSEISNLSQLRALTIHRNSLSGEIPSTLASLADLSEINLDWNALHTDDDTVNTLINQSKLGAIENYNYIDTQTLDASPERVPEIGETAIKLFWDQRNTTPATDGGYKIYIATAATGPYSLNQTVAGKNSDTALVNGLTADTNYFFQVRSYTSPHTENLQVADLESSGLFYMPKEVRTLASGSGDTDVTGSDTGDNSGDDSSSSGGGGGSLAWLLLALAPFGFRAKRKN